ncbi:hypothetical protein M406DRAFT_343397 [Cryphonectria parasitica EP155]|uniref:Uncharacterized protein n=1 Tax=Cryphonectria parasitica (strain ATCC 38755 / EP155) TaxID=660469 RepID=A0A9P5CK09_CRYP1|nr:uncharacterized protein M406DRAFT_343397 [Cryphonectria parasitica EP155]KAF3760265.1 hypothetical protein M406DRAFT_343397 [Cryphonectria parasitica EP155]
MTGLVAFASALPAAPRLTARQQKIYEVMRRQSAAEQALGINDFDVLQFALTLENLETAFYQQGFAALPAQQFLDLGLTQTQVDSLVTIGQSEAAHVEIIQSTLAQMGIQPVVPCQYNFGGAFASAQAMVQTAAILEQVGVSAYLGAAPIVSSPVVLGAAASIFSIEARHQSFIRTVSGIASAPDFFDTPLSPKQVFSLAAPFISSCPQGSNLILTAFPTVSMTNANQQIIADQQLQLQSDASGQATACAFTAGGFPTGSVFTAFTNGACATPQGLTGVVYLNLVSSTPATGKISDDIIVAGPMVLQVS